jgi:hypothetical protein
MENILFVSAQPDVPYFIWQSKLYIHNFISKGINPSNIHVVFGLVNNNHTPSSESLKLKDMGVNVHHFIDERKKKNYIPSIKPFLISKWIEKNPKNGKLFFLHDADIIFNRLPNFKEMLNDEHIYLSDTVGYIGYDYIIDCCRRYESHHKTCQKNQLLEEMAKVIGLEVNVIKENRNNAGGGQYLIKNTDHEIWYKIYLDSIELYNQMLNFQNRFPISPGEIQFWTAEMWSLLWNLWLNNHKTIITKELDFSWATDNVDVYEKKPILHMAGITDDLKKTKFYKGEYINDDPIEKLRNNPKHFDYIESNSSTVKYIEVIKSFIGKTN